MPIDPLTLGALCTGIGVGLGAAGDKLLSWSATPTGEKITDATITVQKWKAFSTPFFEGFSKQPIPYIAAVVLISKFGLQGYRLYCLHISRGKRDELIDSFNKQHLSENKEIAQLMIQRQQQQLAAADDDIHRQEEAYNVEASTTPVVVTGLAVAVVASQALDISRLCASKWLSLDKVPCQLYRDNWLYNDTSDTQTLWAYANHVGGKLIESSGEKVVLSPGESKMHGGPWQACALGALYKVGSHSLAAAPGVAVKVSEILAH